MLFGFSIELISQLWVYFLKINKTDKITKFIYIGINRKNYWKIVYINVEKSPQNMKSVKNCRKLEKDLNKKI